MSAKPLLYVSAGLSAIAFAVVAHAQAQSQSPFAKHGKTQAWETQQPAQTRPQPQRKTQTQAQPQQTRQTGTYQPPSRPGTYQGPSGYSSQSQTYSQGPAGTQNMAGSYSGNQSQAPGTYNPSSPTYQVKPDGGYYDYRAPVSSNQNPNQPVPGYQPQNTGGAYYPGMTPAQQRAARPKSWRDRFGLSYINTSFEGKLALGAAGTERNGDWGEDFIGDGMVRGEVSAVTPGGLEYGVGAELRGQYDKYRRGFGGRVGDCPPTLAGCSTTLVAGTPTSLRGHTSRFYSSGPSDAKDTEIALEGAYLFLRSAYGDVTLGRDDGSAYLFSLGAPTLLAVNASNSPVDYTGLDSVKTINDASGFAEKITYTSPRLLGDTVGVGVQFGASYALDARACGVDYCVRKNAKDPSGALSPDLEDVIEVGVSLDRTFDSGLSVEATGTYARASEKNGNAALDDLSSWGLGLELGYNDFVFGTSYLNSNNALANGDYTAYDAGLTWQPSRLGFTLSYGHAEDKNIGMTSDQGVFGISYDWNENVRLGTGVQYVTRDVLNNVAGIATEQSEDATSIFVEGRVTF